MADAPKAPNQVFLVLKQLKELWEKQPKARRTLALLIVVGILAVVGASSVLKKTETWVVAIEGVSAGDTQTFYTKLLARGIDARLRDGKVEVQEADMYQARAIGALGLGIAGLEQFDTAKMGETEMQQKINFVRAIQGELTRSIIETIQVSSARVSITFGNVGTAIKDMEVAPTAAVTLIPRGGQTVTMEQINGIRAMVAASVGQNLQAAKVVVIGPHGEYGADKSGTDQQSDFETQITGKTTRILETMVGFGHVVVNTQADFDTSKINSVEEEFRNDNPVIRSETQAIHGGDPTQSSIGGVAGAQGNLPGAAAPTGGAAGSAAGAKGDIQFTKNYEISKKTTQTEKPQRVLKKLHLAIIVDQAKDPKTNKAIARSKDELDTMVAIARVTAGIDDARGDTFELKSVAFAPIEEPVMPEAPKSLLPVPMPVAIGGAAGVLVLLVVVVLLLKSRGKKSKTQALVLRGGRLPVPMPVHELERVLDGEPEPAALPSKDSKGLPEGRTVQERVMDVVRTDV
ncbi:MAG: flagellar M-ring protein FliF C-terminal domain-containing protein, partial [Kofleriaceae bacterium]